MEEKKRENFIFRLLNDDFILFFNILSLWQKIDRKVTEGFLCHIVLVCLYFCVSLTISMKFSEGFNPIYLVALYVGSEICTVL